MSERLLTCYYRPKPGGLCLRLFRGMEAIAERGHEVHYLAVEEFPLRHPGCHFHRLWVPTRRRSGALFWAWFLVAAPPVLLWLGLRHRVRYLFAFGSLYGLVLQPLRRISGLPLVVFIRGDAIHFHRFHRRRLLARLELWVEGLGLWGADLVGVSRDLTDRVLERHRWLRPARTSVLPNDLPGVEPAGEPSVPGEAAPFHVLAAGVLYASKNLELLFDSLAQVPRGRFRLTLFGDGPHRPALEALALRLGLDRDVRFAGWVAPEEVWADPGLVAMPSHAEGSPNVVLEALARRFPVLASDIPAHREILPSRALLPADEPSAWARRWLQLAQDPKALARLVAEEAEAALRLRFDWDERFVSRVLSGDRADRGTTSGDGTAPG